MALATRRDNTPRARSPELLSELPKTSDASPAGIWPKSQLLRHGPELPMVERVRRYQHNIRAIRAAGCRVPTPHLVDTLDPDTIEAWFAEGAATSARLRRLIAAVAKLPDDTLLPSPFEGSAR